MYNNEQIQEMLTTVKNNSALKERVLAHFHGIDAGPIRNVIADGWLEAFDRYDSDLCEQFITAYEKETETIQSVIAGIMLKHTDGDFEYYSPELTKEDQNAIFQILDKYGDDNPSLRGEDAEACHMKMTSCFV